MKLYIVFAQRKCRYEGEYAPEALHIADEYSHDENPAWIEKKLAEAEADDEFVSAAIIRIELGDTAFETIQDRLTGMTTVTAAVVD